MNNDDMSELFSKFSNMVNEGNIPDEMKNILSSLSNSNNTSKEESNTNENNGSKDGDGLGIDIETIMKMKKVMDKMKGNANDPRANLLLSLKPYLKESRKDKVDQYIKLFNMSKVAELFNK